MKTAGIICEYNPLHEGHARHIAETRARLGGCAIVCAMSGNFVQRGEPAIFEKHARAAAAVACGADLVIELPVTTVLSSAERFASGAVTVLDALGVCTYLSFGSEAGGLEMLAGVARCLALPEADALIKEELKSGVSYAAARQAAAEKLMGTEAKLLETPNNILAVEYLKALASSGSAMEPLTVARRGGEHGGERGLSASAVRTALLSGGDAWGAVPSAAADIFKKEIAAGRGPVTLTACETAVLARLRMMSIEDYVNLPDAGGGLGERLAKYARTGAKLSEVLAKTKTKRYALSRLRRMVMCAYLGITAEDCARPPAYIRVLAMNSTGRELLRQARERCLLPVITKPASVLAMAAPAPDIFRREAAATDLFVLAYPDPSERSGGQEYRLSPRVL